MTAFAFHDVRYRTLVHILALHREVVASIEPCQGRQSDEWSRYGAVEDGLS